MFFRMVEKIDHANHALEVEISTETSHDPHYVRGVLRIISVRLSV